MIDHGKVHGFVHAVEIGETLHGDQKAEFKDGDTAKNRRLGVEKGEEGAGVGKVRRGER